MAPEYEAEPGEEYARSPDDVCAELPDWEPRPLNTDRALKVQGVYESLPLIERRIVQAEYTRRQDYGAMNGKEREVEASRRLGISREYYKIALNALKAKVWEVCR